MVKLCIQNNCRYCKDKTKFGGQNRLRQKCLHRRCQLDTHRRRSSQNQASQSANTLINTNGHVGNNSSFSDNVAVSRQSPSPDAIYSGVALARLASQKNLEDVAKESVKNGQMSPGEMLRNSGLLGMCNNYCGRVIKTRQRKGFTYAECQ